MGKIVILIFFQSILFAGENLSLDGSSTVFPIAEELIDSFKKNKKDKISFQNEQSSSTGGIKRLLEGSIDIARISRPIKFEEVESFSKKGLNIYSIHIAYDAIGVAVHPSKKKYIKYLNKDNIRKIFIEGSLKNWSSFHKNLKGKINVYIGDKHGSATSELFRKWLSKSNKKEKYGEYVRALGRTDLAVKSVQEDKNGITISPLGIAHGVYLVPLMVSSGKIITCDVSNVRLGRYPLSRDLFFVAKYPFLEKVAMFLEFSVSLAGQKVVKKLGHIPIFEAGDY